MTSWRLSWPDMLNVSHCPLHCRISLHPVHQRPPARALCDATGSTGGKENVTTTTKTACTLLVLCSAAQKQKLQPNSIEVLHWHPTEAKKNKHTDPYKPSGNHQFLQIKIKGVDARFPTNQCSYPFALKPKMKAVTYKNNNKKNDYKLEYNLKFQENNWSSQFKDNSVS